MREIRQLDYIVEHYDERSLYTLKHSGNGTVNDSHGVGDAWDIIEVWQNKGEARSCRRCRGIILRLHNKALKSRGRE